MKKDFILFLLASAFLGIGQSVDTSAFNNFLNDTFQITVVQRTMLEMPREFPGFMVVFISGFLFFLGDVRMAAAANLIAAAGMMGLGYLSPQFGIMVAWLAMYSAGQHLFMPLSNSIGMNLAQDGNVGKKLGQISSANTAVFLLGSITVALWFRFGGVNYKGAFTLGAFSYVMAAVMLLMMRPHTPARNGKLNSFGIHFVFRKEYGLFYWLNIFYGARKQIFITFGPWVLIKVFNQTAANFAVLGFITAVLMIFFKPLVGHLIDRIGERRVLAGEAALLILVCAIYGFAQKALNAAGLGGVALYVICACFIADQILNAVSMARATYLKKIAVKPEDISPTLSMGISIDHVVSMLVPWLGGAVWSRFGYEYVFMIGAMIALINLISVRRIGMENSIKTGETCINELSK